MRLNTIQLSSYHLCTWLEYNSYYSRQLQTNTTIFPQALKIAPLKLHFFFFCLYLHWVQYLHVPQDPKCYVKHSNVEVQSNSRNYWHSPKLRDRGSRMTIYQRPGGRTQWQRTTILSGHTSHYVPACTWDWSHVLCVLRRVCYPLGHSGSADKNTLNSFVPFSS